jgi:LPS-assembly lipoprotein
MINRRLFLLSTTASALLAGCDFHLRGKVQMAFTRIYIGGSLDAASMNEVRKVLSEDVGLTITPTPEEAQVVVTLSALTRDKQVLTLNAQGLVSQYLLTVRMSFRASDASGTELLAPSTASVTRQFNYSDAQILAKQQEEQQLYKDMQQEVLLQLLRRLSAIKINPTVKP